MIIKPDILADINFYTTENNGRETAITALQFGTIFQIGNDKHDCRLLLNNVGQILPGDSKKDIPIKFLYSEIVLPKLQVGSNFYLWDMRNIAEGTITAIVTDL